MSSNGFTPYTVPYSGVAGSAKFVPGAASHPLPPQEKNGQGIQQVPTVAQEPEAADTGRSKGESIAADTVGGPPEDAIPARFASAAAAAASGGIAIAPDGLGAVGASSEPGVVTSSGQKSGQTKGVKSFNLNNSRTFFGTDGQSDYEDMPSSPTTMTMSAQRRADRALPVLAQQLKDFKAENERLRDSLSCSSTAVAESNMLRQLIGSYQAYNRQLQVQVQSLYVQTQNLQQHAQNFARQCGLLQARVNNATLSLQELTDLIVRLQSIIRRIDPDVFVTFPDEVQEMLSAIHEEWKYQEYCKLFHPKKRDNSSGSDSSQPQSAVQGQFNSSGNGASDTGNVSVNEPSNTFHSTSGATFGDNNQELFAQLFPGLTLGGLNIVNTVPQTPQLAQASRDNLGPYTPSTLESVRTPRTVYSPGTPRAAQDSQSSLNPQRTQAVQHPQAAPSLQGSGSPQTTEGIRTPNTVDSCGTLHTPEH